jgi:hypothetical protein
MFCNHLLKLVLPLTLGVMLGASGAYAETENNFETGVKRTAQKTGNAIEKGAIKTKEGITKAAQHTDKALHKAAAATGTALKKTGEKIEEFVQ